MPFIADLHIHSRYSRATSPALCFEQLYAWGRRKGIGLIGTGDCTHPAWRAEMAEKLLSDGDGLYRLREEMTPPCELGGEEVRFLITGEISTIYKADGATRKVHHVVCLPDLDAAERFAARLERIGNIASDGRPILGLDSRDLLEVLLEASPDAVLIPAHIWTPWFSALGSKSGFDSIADCYRDLADHIFAVETGLSSDPAMNWMVSSLDRYTLVSNSDAHSPAKLGREANVFTGEMGYTAVMDALQRKRPGFWGTIEFFPEEGKYHVDGHRKCDFSCSPEESKALNGKCPVCGGSLTLGVEYRVTELADRPRGTVPEGAFEYQSLLSLPEILGELQFTSATSKKVARIYEGLLAQLGPELHILRTAEIDEIREVGGELLARAIEKMRSGAVHAVPGYDGEYGVITLFTEQERAEVMGQIQLFAGLSLNTPAKPRVTRNAPAPAPVPETPVVEERENVEQDQAIHYPPAPLIIVAGPGAGKTRTLVERIAWLATEQHIEPPSMLAITFSNRAAREMSERITARLANLPVRGRPTVATFHKLGLQIINEHRQQLGFTTPVKMLSAEEASDIFAECAPSSVANLDELEPALLQLFTGIGGDPDAIAARVEQARQLAPEYAARKRERGALDFTDLLVLPLALLAGDAELRRHYQQRWPHVFVDEYQDVNALQYLFLRLLCPVGGDLCVIGDPDQAIYGFRGADVRYFLRFQLDYPDTGHIALTRNYRSTRTIVDASAQVIAQGSLREERKLWSTRSGPAQVELTTLPTPPAEAEYVVQTIESLMGGISHFSVDSGRSGDGVGKNLGFNDIAVLYRTHALGDEVQEALARSGIPFQRARRKDLFQRTDVRRMLALFELATEPASLTAAETLLRAGLSGMTKAAAQRLAARLATLPPADAPIIDVLRFSGGLAPEEMRALAGVQETLELLTPDVSPMRAVLQACLLYGISEDTLQQPPWTILLRHAEDTPDLPTFLQQLRIEQDIDVYDPRAARVTLMTAHAAKGLEWEVVFMVGCEEGCFPHPAAPVEEERRLFYVGMTRARTQLLLSHAESRMQQGEHTTRRVSPFVEVIPPELLLRNTPTYHRPKRAQNTQLALTDLF